MAKRRKNLGQLSHLEESLMAAERGEVLGPFNAAQELMDELLK